MRPHSTLLPNIFIAIPKFKIDSFIKISTLSLVEVVMLNLSRVSLQLALSGRWGGRAPPSLG